MSLGRKVSSGAEPSIVVHWEESCPAMYDNSVWAPPPRELWKAPMGLGGTTVQGVKVAKLLAVPPRNR